MCDMNCPLPLDMQKYSKIAILDTCFVGNLYTIQKRTDKCLYDILEDYDLILIPKWVWFEICEVSDREEWFEQKIKSRYNVEIIKESVYSELVSFKEADLFEIFFAASDLIAPLKSWLKKNVKTRDILNLRSYADWISNLYDEWPMKTDQCASGRVKNKNAGDISITVLAEILSRYYTNMERVTIYSDDNDCYAYVNAANKKLDTKIKRIANPIKITLKSMDVIIGQMIKNKSIDKEEVDRLRLNQNRKLKYCQKLKDYSIREFYESVSNNQLISMAVNDDFTIIF